MLPKTIWKEFIRPRTQPGITRCPATQISDPTNAQAMPASAAQIIKADTCWMDVIAIIAPATIAIAIDRIGRNSRSEVWQRHHRSRQ